MSYVKGKIKKVGNDQELSAYSCKNKATITKSRCEQKLCECVNELEYHVLL